MNTSKAIANELEASNVGLNTTQNVAFGSGYSVLLYSIASNDGFGGIGKNELVGVKILVDIYDLKWIDTNGTSFGEFSFTYGNEIKYFYAEITSGNGEIISLLACTNWAKYTDGATLTKVGYVFIATNNNIKLCTKSKALTFGCSVQNATSYTDEQLVKYTDLYKNTVGSYKVTIDNSTSYTLLVNESAVSPLYFNVGASIRLTTNAPSNYIVTYKYKIGNSTSYTTLGGSVFTMPDNDVTVTITVSDMAEVHIILPTGATIKVNGSSSSVLLIKIGTTVTLSVTTSDGYSFLGYTFKKTDGNAISLDNPFIMPSYTVVVSGHTNNDSSGGEGSDPGGSNKNEVVVLNVPNTSAARSGWVNFTVSSNIVDNVSEFAPASFEGLFSEETQLLSSAPNQSDLLTQDGMSEYINSDYLGELFFQNDTFSAQADVFLVNTFSANVSAYSGIDQNDNFALLTSVAINLSGETISNFGSNGTLTVYAEYLQNGVLLRITCNPSTYSYNELCTLIVIDVGGNYYCIGYLYGYPENDSRNNLYWSLSPVYNLFPKVTLDDVEFPPIGLARGYTTSVCSAYDNAIHTLANDNVDNEFHSKEIILTPYQPSLTGLIDYRSMYLTVTTVRPEFTPIMNDASCWSILQGLGFGEWCILMFNTAFVDYVAANYLNYFEFISDSGFIISFENLFEFENSDYAASINWFTHTVLDPDLYTLRMSMPELRAGESYVSSDYLGMLQENTHTLYFSIIYRGHIWAYLYNPYNTRNIGQFAIDECTVGASAINGAVDNPLFYSSYEPLPLTLEGEPTNCNMLLNYGA